MSYDEKSNDSMFTKIMGELEHQRKDAANHRAELIAVLVELKSEVKTTNGRVRGLERWRDVITAKVVGISVGSCTLFSAAVWVYEKVNP